MKILQINSFCGVASTGRIAKDIHQLLLKQGHESLVAFAREPSNQCLDGYKFGGQFNFLFHVAYTFITDRQSFASVLATKRLIKKIRSYNPDLIHLHIMHGYYINIELLFTELKRLNKPVVWTFHDCWAFTGHCAHFEYVGCSRWREQCFSCPQKNQYPISLLLDHSRKNYLDKKRLFNGLNDLTIVTPSKWLADLVHQSFLKQWPVQVINNGVDTEIFNLDRGDFRKQHGLEKHVIILAVATVWRTRKGLDDLYKLAAQLSPAEKLVVVGVDAQQCKRLPHNVLGIQRTHDIYELADIYSAADVFINPTYEENFPTTNLEALASGTPVITYRTGGSIESVQEETGIVIEQGDIVSLSSAIRRIASEKKAFNPQVCRDNAVEFYRKQDRYQEYLDLYKYILNRSASC